MADEDVALAIREGSMGDLDARVQALACMMRDRALEPWRLALAAHARHLPAMVLAGQARVRCARCGTVRGVVDGSCPRCGRTGACPSCWSCECFRGGGPAWSIENLPLDGASLWLGTLRNMEFTCVPWPWSRIAVVVAVMGAARKALEAMGERAEPLDMAARALDAAQAWIDEREHWRRDFHAATLPMGKAVPQFAQGPALAIIGSDPMPSVEAAAVATLPVALRGAHGVGRPDWSIIRAMQSSLARWSLPGAP